MRDEAASDGAARWRDYSVNCLRHRPAPGAGSVRDSREPRRRSAAAIRS